MILRVLADDVLHGFLNIREDRRVSGVALGQFAEVVAGAVQVLELAPGDRLAGDDGAVGHVVNHQGDLAAAGNVFRRFEDRGDGSRLPVDDEEQLFCFRFLQAFEFGDAAFVAQFFVPCILATVVRDLRIEVGEAGGVERGHGRVFAPGGGIAAASEEDQGCGGGCGECAGFHYQFFLLCVVMCALCNGVSTQGPVIYRYLYISIFKCKCQYLYNVVITLHMWPRNY